MIQMREYLEAATGVKIGDTVYHCTDETRGLVVGFNTYTTKQSTDIFVIVAFGLEIRKEYHPNELCDTPNFN